MKVLFRSKQSYLQVAHEELFHVGVVITSYDVNGKWLGSQAEWEALQKLPDPEMVNNSYCFCEGEELLYSIGEKIRTDILPQVLRRLKFLENLLIRE